MRRRDNYIDVAKGLCILFVITIHTELFGEIGTPYPVLAVPFFFFISGFYDRSNSSFEELIKKSLHRLLFPTFIWMLIAYVQGSVMHFAGHGTIPFEISWTKPVFANGAAWFIFALFYTKVVMWCISKLHLPRFVQPFFVLLIGMLGCRFEMPLLIDEGLSALPIYYAGKKLYSHLGKIIENRLVIIFSVISFCSIALDIYPYVLVPMRGRPVIYYPLFLAVAIFSFFFFLFICHKLQNVKWLQKYGQHTFCILLTHCMFLHTFAVIFNRVLVKGSFVWIIAFSLAYVFTCIISYWISVWCEKHAPLLVGK